MAAGEGEVRVEVTGVFEQQAEGAEHEQRVPVLALKDVLNREVHVPIGSCEALAVHVALKQHAVARPLTHDLAMRLLQTFSASLTRVVVYDLPGDTYRARLYLNSASGEMPLDVSPGDAVALALRAEAPIYVMEDVFARAGPPHGDAA